MDENLHLDKSLLKKYQTTNTAMIEGPVIKLTDGEKVMSLVLYTSYKKGGKYSETHHTVYIKKNSLVYPNAKYTKVGDLVRVIGPIAADRSIVVKLFLNIQYYFDNRWQRLKQESNNGQLLQKS